MKNSVEDITDGEVEEMLRDLDKDDNGTIAYDGK